MMASGWAIIAIVFGFCAFLWAIDFLGLRQ